MKKIVILSERLPFPPTSGTKNLLYHYCRILHESLGWEVVSISFLEKGDDLGKKPDFISRVYPLPEPRGRAKLCNLLTKTLLMRRLPIQVSLFWDSKIKKQVDSILEKEQPDCVMADLIRTTEYLKDFKGPKLVDMQDLFSLRYERQLKVDLSTLNPYGAYLFRLPKMIQKPLEAVLVKKAVMLVEIWLLKKYECSVGRQYDRVTFVAERESELFNRRLGEKKAVTLPLGVDYDWFSEDREIVKIPDSIAFLGALDVAHNENGILSFAQRIFPLVKEKLPEARLYIIGQGETKAVRALASDSIILTGFVSEVRDAVRACRAFICPLRFGSGIKNKNLEAMAMGVPVVTTPIGAENINAADNICWLIAEDDQEFADKLVMLLQDEALQERLRTNAQDFVRENFTWKLTERCFRQLLADLTGGKLCEK